MFNLFNCDFDGGVALVGGDEVDAGGDVDVHVVVDGVDEHDEFARDVVDACTGLVGAADEAHYAVEALNDKSLVGLYAGDAGMGHEDDVGGGGAVAEADRLD